MLRKEALSEGTEVIVRSLLGRQGVTLRQRQTMDVLSESPAA